MSISSGAAWSRQIFDSVTSDATDSTVYSYKIQVHQAPVWSIHFVADDDSTTYAAAITLWASNKATPDEADDTDWVQMTSDHGWDGMPGGDPTGDDYKAMADVGNSGALWYRLKVVRSAGSATLDCWAVAKMGR